MDSSDSIFLEKIRSLEEYQHHKRKILYESSLIIKRTKNTIKKCLIGSMRQNIAVSVYGSLFYGVMSNYSDKDIFVLHEGENEFLHEILKKLDKESFNSNWSIQLYNTNRLEKGCSLCTITNLLNMEFVEGDMDYYKNFTEKVISKFKSFNISDIFLLLHEDNLFICEQNSRERSIIFFSIKSGPGGIIYINSANLVASWYKLRGKKLPKNCLVYLEYLNRSKEYLCVLMAYIRSVLKNSTPFRYSDNQRSNANFRVPWFFSANISERIQLQNYVVYTKFISEI